MVSRYVEFSSPLSSAVSIICIGMINPLRITEKKVCASYSLISLNDEAASVMLLLRRKELPTNRTYEAILAIKRVIKITTASSLKGIVLFPSPFYPPTVIFLFIISSRLAVILCKIL
jgi:hypothetical protein